MTSMNTKNMSLAELRAARDEIVQLLILDLSKVKPPDLRKYHKDYRQVSREIKRKVTYVNKSNR